jgi:hypothetical protein
MDIGQLRGGRRLASAVGLAFIFVFGRQLLDRCRQSAYD